MKKIAPPDITGDDLNGTNEADLLELGFSRRDDGSGSAWGIDWVIDTDKFHLVIGPTMVVKLYRRDPDSDGICLYVDGKSGLQEVIDWMRDDDSHAAADKWRLAYEALTPQGSEFYNDLERCQDYVQKMIRSGHDAQKEVVKLRRSIAKEVEDAVRAERERIAAQLRGMWREFDSHDQWDSAIEGLLEEIEEGADELRNNRG